MDVVLGRFADLHLEKFNEAMLQYYETILDLPDPDLFSWLVGIAPMPADILENPAMQLLLDTKIPKE